MFKKFMKILAFTDLHGNKISINKIIKKSELADVVVCAGDLSNFSIDLDMVLKKLKRIKKPLLIINGNHELDFELKRLCKKYRFIFMHKSIYKIKDYLFLGFGGGGFSRVNEEFEDWSGKLKLDKKENIILVTHAPPYNTKVDFIPGVGHVGNISIRKFMDKIKPKLVICGHLHENFNIIDKTKNTIIVNPGREGIILEV